MPVADIARFLDSLLKSPYPFVIAMILLFYSGLSLPRILNRNGFRFFVRGLVSLTAASMIFWICLFK